MINLENVQTLVRMAYLPHASEAFGEPGARAITTLLDAVRLIYQRYPPESLHGTLTVIIGMNATPAAPMIAAWDAPSALQRGFSRWRQHFTLIGGGEVYEGGEAEAAVVHGG